MRDIHSHILPGIDDGPATVEKSMEMLAAAKAAGVSSIVCTPHVRDPYFDYDAFWEAFWLLKKHAKGFPLKMGFEVNHTMFMQLGMDWADKLCFDGSNDFLLELSTRASAYEYGVFERTIFELRSRGYRVIIAHPERYEAIQQDINLAHDLVRWGAALQVSADYIVGGRTGASKKPAQRLFKEGLVSFLASDAHIPEHYDYLAKARSMHKPLGAYANLNRSAAVSALQRTG
ncbi:MAG: phosphoesterase [Coriobacteriia bacterium]|nr:phosphoesterase [Coriobacteriia bacterium]